MKWNFGTISLFCLLIAGCTPRQATYVCTPCNLGCDDLVFQKPGSCPHCAMPLVAADSLKTVEIKRGSGFFQLDREGGRSIAVFYHRPKRFHTGAEILFVIPGSGRGAAEYRDTWIEHAEKFGVLIVAPMFPERFYGFEEYHLCGLAKSSNLEERVSYIEGTNVAQLREDGLTFELNSDPQTWLFAEFDHIFDLVKKAVGSTQERYHLFGHSAGGHILHRLALFGNSPRVGKIMPANASFYTLPDPDIPFPFGLGGTPADSASLRRAFAKEMILFLGEKDNEKETGGTFLRSYTADEQGLHRLARGQYFFARARETAAELGYPFNWELVLVPGVGHDQEGMGQAAADYFFPSRK